MRARVQEESVSPLRIFSGLAIFAGVIADTVIIFSKLQDADSGDFAIAGLGEVDWISFAVVTAVCVGVAIMLKVIDGKKAKQ